MDIRGPWCRFVGTPIRRGMLVALGVLSLCASGAAVGAEIYRWTDGSGRLHFSQELGKVPPAQREQARRGAAERKTKRDALQIYDAGPASPGASFLARPASLRSGRSYRIPFERRGTLMKVDVLLNDRVTAPFYIDTGASGVSIPWVVAQQLGIQVTQDTPRINVKTANGVIAEPLVELRSVQLGSARVSHLKAAVSGSMDIGLLGGAFFNNFIYEVDAAAGVINLRPNDRVRGGLNQEQWRVRFEAILEPLQRLEAYLEKGGFTEEGRVRELEQHREKLRSSFEDLEHEANQAGVPRGWRR